ncbi:MAG: hypothetical protein AABZ31_08935 [Bdellovibrionota bacterium]
MMQRPSLFSSLGRRLRFYKAAFVICIFLNVTCIVTGTVLAVNYWNSSLSGYSTSEKLTQNIIITEKIDSHLKEMEESLEKKSRTSFTRENLFDELVMWQKLDELRLQTQLEPIDKSQIRTRDGSIEFVDRLISENRAQRARYFDEWQNLRTQQTRPMVLLIIIGLFALICGLLLPLYFLRQISNQINELKSSLARSAQDITREWMHALTQFGDQPFKNIDFWLHIALLGANYLGKTSYHPSIQLISEMARLIRLELQKNSTNLNNDKAPRA